MTYHTYGSENMLADYRKYLKLLDRQSTEINGLKKLLKYCETNNIDFMGMDYDSFQDFFLELKTNSKAKNSFNASLFNIRGFYKFLVESKNVDKSILDVLKLFKPYAVEHKIKSYVTKEELAEIVHMSETFCSYMDVTKIKALLYFMFFTGMRRGEILRLKREQIDLEKRTVLVKTPTKNKMERIIPIPKVIEKTKFNKSFNFVDMLKEYFATEGENKNAFNMSEANFDFFFKQIKEYAPEKNITPHTLRHSFARMLARKGIDSRIAQKLLGHKDIATTMIYYDPDIDTIHDIYDEKVK